MPAHPDSFEIVRDCRALFLKLLGELLQDTGALTGAAIQAVQHGAGSYFDEMLLSKPRGSFKEEAGGLTSSRITLVGEDALELDIRIDNLATRFFDATGGSLWKLNLRLVTLLNRPDLSRSNNPIDPKGICRGLNEMLAAASTLTLDKKLDLLGRLESGLLQHLPDLYNKLNDFLELAGIEAAQPIIVSAPTSKAAKPGPESATVSLSLLQALQQMLLSRLPNPSAAGGGEGSAVGAALSQSAMERLLFRLNELDRPGKLAADFDPVASHSLETLIPGLFEAEEAAPTAKPTALTSQGLGLPANTPEGLAIDTLASLFASIWDDPTLPEALKSVISRLQITILKIALSDAGFFSDAGHPARLLLDRLHVAMLGLPLDTTVKHPFCARILEIATQLQGRFNGSVAVFEDALEQLEPLIAGRQASIVEMAKPYLPLLQQLDRRDQGLVEARRVIDKAITTDTPARIREFFTTSWRKVLLIIWLEHGPDSSQWATYTNVIGGLLWTFQPKPGAEKRNELNRRLPEILEVLKAGMDRLGMSEAQQAAFFDVCFALQTEALRSTPSASVPPESRLLEPGAWSAKASKPVLGEIGSGELRLQTLDMAETPASPVRKLPCAPGDWLQVQLDESTSCVGYLSHLSPGGQRTLLCNPDGGLVLSVHAAILERQLRDGQAHVVSAQSLFEKAADNALRRTGGK